MISGVQILGEKVKNVRLILDNSEDDSIKSHQRIIIYSPSLTNDVALKVVKNNNIIGVITTQSSFATHGANIIRSFCAKEKKKKIWVSKIKWSEVETLIGSYINIDNGIITRTDFDENYENVYKYESSNIMNYFTPQKIKTIIKYNINTGKYSICYWPHRKYDVFTSSIMIEGLEQNFSRYFNKEVSIIRDDEGKLWFNNGILSEQLIVMANNVEYAERFLIHQINFYSKVIRCLKTEVYTQKDIIEMLVEYFSVFLLFHNTYEQVFYNAYNCLKVEIGYKKSREFLDFLMFCEIDEWMMQLNYPLEKHKELFCSEKVTPIPQFTIEEDINNKIDKVKIWFKENNLKKIYDLEFKRINYWVQVFTVKEWKFVINKILFTRFGSFWNDDLLINEVKKVTYKQYLKSGYYNNR